MDFRSIIELEVAEFVVQNCPIYKKKKHFLHLLPWSLKKIGGHIDQKIFYHLLEQQKLFSLVTNFMQIGSSKAEKYWN